VIVPYSIATYRRADLPPIVLRNLFVEKTPDSPPQIALLPRGGLEAYQSIGSGPIRGVFQRSGALSGATFSVSGGNLYSGTTSLGGLGGSGLVRWAASLNTLLIATGGPLYSSDGSAVGNVAFPDGAGVTDVAFLGGYALAARAGSRRIYFTLDPATWDGLDFISTTSSTANIVGFAVVSDQLWVFTEDKTYIFVLTGNADAPLQAVPGRVFDKGCLNRNTITVMDNTVMWTGSDGIDYRADNSPQRISDHGVEEAIALTDSANLSAWTFPWFGHTIRALNTARGTLAYDAATQQWHELASKDRETWRAWTGQLVGRDVICGDDETGQLWKLSSDTLMDGDDLIEREFTILFNDRGFIDRLTFDCTTGVTGGADQPAGTIEARSSRDGGFVWREWQDASLGVEGQYRAHPAWRNFGMVDEHGMIVQVRLTDPRYLRISDVRVNEPAGGRSR
jgi:hypothetical protein